MPRGLSEAPDALNNANNRKDLLLSANAHLYQSVSRNEPSVILKQKLKATICYIVAIHCWQTRPTAPFRGVILQTSSLVMGDKRQKNSGRVENSNAILLNHPWHLFEKMKNNGSYPPKLAHLYMGHSSKSSFGVSSLDEDSESPHGNREYSLEFIVLDSCAFPPGSCPWTSMLPF